MAPGDVLCLLYRLANGYLDRLLVYYSFSTSLPEFWRRLPSFTEFHRAQLFIPALWWIS